MILLCWFLKTFLEIDYGLESFLYEFLSWSDDLVLLLIVVVPFISPSFLSLKALRGSEVTSPSGATSAVGPSPETLDKLSAEAFSAPAAVVEARTAVVPAIAEFSAA